MSLRDHQIEEILLGAHLSDIDLIEEYFSRESSLDPITKKAHQMLLLHSDEISLNAIKRNLSECIIVKSQMKEHSINSLIKKAFKKMGLDFGKDKEITRAEVVLEKIKKKGY